MIASNRFEWFVAWRYLRPKRREGFVSVITGFSIIGIMLGVATLILVTSLMNGIREEMISRFIGVGGHISIYSQFGKINDGNRAIVEAAKAGRQFSSLTPKITGHIMAVNRGAAEGGQVISIPNASYDQPNSLLAEAMGPELVRKFKNSSGVIIGSGLAKRLRLSVGDSITLISPEGRTTFAGFVPRMKSYPVVGTIKLGMHMYDSTLVLMPFEEAQVYFRFTEGDNKFYEKLDIYLKDSNTAPHYAQEMQQQLGPNFIVLDWQRANRSVFSALLVQRNVMVVILTLIVLVAAFNIISSLIMLVQDKRADVAILRTIGATRRNIMSIFCITGTIIGVFGTMLGWVLGLLAAANIEGIKQFIEEVTGQQILVEEIYFLSTLPTKTDPLEVAAIVFLSILISFLATLYPAWRAAKLHPVEALRHE